jgi:hypothetical protein
MSTFCSYVDLSLPHVKTGIYITIKIIEQWNSEI